MAETKAWAAYSGGTMDECTSQCVDEAKTSFFEKRVTKEVTVAKKKAPVAQRHHFLVGGISSNGGVRVAVSARKKTC